jgi:cytoskeletal protein CcmA (bactofilin family)
MGWFGRPSRPAQHEALETVVGSTSSFHGTLRSDGGARIEGALEGLIEVGGNVVIGQGGRVVADVTARNLTVGGTLQGNADVAGQLQILSTGQVVGDITVASVMIDEGGVFQGVSRMRGMAQPALPAPRDVDASAFGAAAAAGATGATGATASPAAAAGAAPPLAEATVDVTARPVATPEESIVIEPVREAAPAAPSDIDLDYGLDLDRLDIQPVIPDVVIEDVTETPPPARPPGGSSRRRRGRGNGQ